MTVQPDALVRLFVHRQVQVAVRFLALEQIFDAAADDVRVLVFPMTVAARWKASRARAVAPVSVTSAPARRGCSASSSCRRPVAAAPGSSAPNRRSLRSAAAGCLGPAPTLPRRATGGGGRTRWATSLRCSWTASRRTDAARTSRSSRDLHALADSSAVVQTRCRPRIPAPSPPGPSTASILGRAAFGGLTRHVRGVQGVAGAVIGVRCTSAANEPRLGTSTIATSTEPAGSAARSARFSGSGVDQPAEGRPVRRAG